MDKERLTKVCTLNHLGDCLVFPRSKLESREARISSIKLIDEFAYPYRYMILLDKESWILSKSTIHKLNKHRVTMTNFRLRQGESYLQVSKSVANNIKRKNFTEYATSLPYNSRILMFKSNIPALRIMTSGDRDFGDIWIGGQCVKEGNRYGDTTTFPVVGVVAFKSYMDVWNLWQNLPVRTEQPES